MAYHTRTSMQNWAEYSGTGTYISWQRQVDGIFKEILDAMSCGGQRLGLYERGVSQSSVGGVGGVEN